MLKLQQLLFTACLAAVIAPAQDNYKNGQDLTGSWHIVATIPAGVPICQGTVSCSYQALATANADGTTIQTHAIPGSSIGHGAWKRTGLRTFRMRTVYFRIDSNNIQIGTSVTSIDIEVDKNGLTAAGKFTATVNMLSGQSFVYSGVITADRIEVQ